MATFVVNTTVDELDGSIVDGDISLRDAVAAANAAAGADTVAFDATIFNGEAGDILRLTQGDITVSDTLTIDGGAAGVTITGDANGDDLVLAGGITDAAASRADDRFDDNTRIFITFAPTTLDHLTLTGGYATESGSGGGAVLGAGDVTIQNSTIAGNASYARGGGLSGLTNLTVRNSTVSDNITFGARARGGGIDGTYVEVIDSTVVNNSTSGDFAYGGGVAGISVTLTNSTVSSNRTSGSVAYGAGVFGESSAELFNSTVSGNIAEGNYVRYGGAFAIGSLALTNSLVIGNSSTLEPDVQVGSSNAFSSSHSLVGVDGRPVFAETTEIAPGIFAGVLADNGGPTETVAILAGGLAAGAADPATATETDQRGVTRDADPDAGAFEAEQVTPPDSFRIEAESLARHSGFRVENVPAASGGKVIKSPNPSVEASASFAFTGQDGTYDLDLGYFDEKDGRSELSVFVNEIKVDSFVFKANLGSNQANAKTAAVRHIDDLEIETGDVIKLVGHSNRDEPLRIDYLEFTFVDDFAA